MSAGELFNPAPAVLESPQGNPDQSTARLNTDAGEKTPTAKNLDPKWVRNLVERGQPVVYTRENSKDFAYIGMPVGGIGAGEIYLGGDGRLWMWDVFNSRVQPNFPVEGGLAYKSPHLMGDPADKDQYVPDQGFVLRTSSRGTITRHTLNRDGFSDVKFTGQYPIGYVDYADPSCPVQVRLEAFSPFVPGVEEDSSYPATVLNYTLTNHSSDAVTCDFAGWLENSVAVKSRGAFDVNLQNTITKSTGATTLSCSAVEVPPRGGVRPVIVYDDFEGGTYDKWTVEGTAFGTAPVQGGLVPGGKPPRNFQGKYLVNGYLDGTNKGKGKMTSKPFVIERSYITFLEGGGYYPGRLCINLLVDGKTVLTAPGQNGGAIRPVVWNVKDLAGKTARLELVDMVSGNGQWNHLMADNFVFRDELEGEGAFADEPDVGTLALTLVGDAARTVGSAKLAVGESSEAALSLAPSETANLLLSSANPKLVGALGRKLTLAPGAKVTLNYIVSWHFPNPLRLSLKTPMAREYTARFKSARDVADHLAADLDRLTQATRLWHDTWYDSTLPFWFLDRTFANVSTLATSTTYRLSDGRFYGYEGGYSCPGTCTHVWGYQPTVGFLFPDLEKTLLKQVEFADLGMNAAGGIAMRAEFDHNVPVDGQAGIIMRAYLAHRMSTNNDFLISQYKSIKKAADFLINTYDADKDGIMEGNQRNTMDAGWWGKIPWLSLYYQAALTATAQMADEMDDKEYAASLRPIIAKGRDYIEHKLFNGEFFFHEANAEHINSPGTYIGCHIDQLMGQNWAYINGLGQVIDPAQAAKALNAIWKYNFTTDVGLYKKRYNGGRIYALPGESGVIVCTFPLGGDDALHKGLGQFAAYMNEVWAGCEHQLAATMMWQGMVDKSLAIERAIDERYAASKRNPWDECECGSHYSRSLDSYGTFIAACGFEYDGPAGYMAFCPRVGPENFKGAFTSAAGWGSFSQRYNGTALNASLAVRHGELTLKTLALTVPAGKKAAVPVLSAAGRPVQTTTELAGTRLVIHFLTAVQLKAGQSLDLSVQ